MSKHSKRRGPARPPEPEAHAPQAATAEQALDQAPGAPAHEAGQAPVPASAPAPAPAAPASRTAGQMLRAMREEAGVDAALVASGMKVSLQKIQALEEDRFEDLPDLTFARGLASAISRAFGVDPAPVLERMPVPASGLRALGPGLNQPFRSADATPALIDAAASGIPKPVWWLAAALALGALALWLLPPLPIQLNAPLAPAGEHAPAAARTGMVQESLPVPGAAAAGGQVSAAAALASEPAPVASGTASDAAAEQATSPAQTASAAAEASASANAAGKLLAFAATGQSWIAVRDAAGRQILNRTLGPGDTVAVSGETPLSVTIGRKEVVNVTVRGEPFDLRGLGSASVARFQVN